MLKLLILFSVLTFFLKTNAQSTCPSAIPDPGVCASLNFDLQRELYLNNYLLHAQENRPEEAVTMLHQLQDLIAMGFICGNITNCQQLSAYRPEVELGGGWSQSIMVEYSEGEVTSEGLPTCRVISTLEIAKGQAVITGIIAQETGRLMYQLPASICRTDGREIERQTYVNEAGVLLVDYATDVESPGEWQMFSARHTPRLEVQTNGSIRVIMAGDHYFEVGAENGLISGSDLFDVATMYDPAQCHSSISTVRRRGEVRVRAIPDVVVLRRSSSAISRRFEDSGSASMANRIHNYIDGLAREP
jgi:hypothetical protein